MQTPQTGHIKPIAPDAIHKTSGTGAQPGASPGGQIGQSQMDTLIDDKSQGHGAAIAST